MDTYLVCPYLVLGIHQLKTTFVMTPCRLSPAYLACRLFQLDGWGRGSTVRKWWENTHYSFKNCGNASTWLILIILVEYKRAKLVFLFFFKKKEDRSLRTRRPLMSADTSLVRSFYGILKNLLYIRGKSLLELWVTTFLPDWQPPLIFVLFISNFLCICSCYL